MLTCILQASVDIHQEQNCYKVSVAIMGHLRTLQYYYSKEAYRDFNFDPDSFTINHIKIKFKG